MEYADFTYYSETYKGSLSNDLFSSYILKASKEVDRNVNRVLTDDIIEELSDNDQDKLQYATCEMVDLLYNYNEIESNFREVESISIDGVSKKYKSASDLRNEIDSKKIIIVNDLPQELMRYI